MDDKKHNMHGIQREYPARLIQKVKKNQPPEGLTDFRTFYVLYVMGCPKKYLLTFMWWYDYLLVKCFIYDNDYILYKIRLILFWHTRINCMDSSHDVIYTNFSHASYSVILLQ